MSKKLVYVTSAFVVFGGLLVGGGVALSQKGQTLNVAGGGRAVCENPAVVEKVQQAVAMAIESGHWTAKNHDQIRPLFHQLRTQQKVELLRRIAAAIDAKKLVVDKGAHLF